MARAVSATRGGQSNKRTLDVPSLARTEEERKQEEIRGEEKRKKEEMTQVKEKETRVT